MSLQMEMNLKYREGLKAGEEKGRALGQSEGKIETQKNINRLNKILLSEKDTMT